MKRQIGSRKLLLAVIPLGMVLILSFSHETILIGAGRYLAPEGIGKADVAILEGTEIIRMDAVQVGVRILSSGRASRLVIVYQNSENEKVFGRPSNYDLFLIQKLEDLGLRKDQIQIIGVPKQHPITLAEARLVLSILSKNGVRSTILLAESFHTRRSLWAYKQVGMPLGIEIIPYPYFIKYHGENWWHEIHGIREFFEESLKFLYYILRGYIPIKSLVAS